MMNFEVLGFSAARQGTSWEILFWLKNGGAVSWKLDSARNYYECLGISSEATFDSELKNVDEVVVSKFAHPRKLVLKFNMSNMLLAKNLIGNKESLFIHPKEWKNL